MAKTHTPATGEHSPIHPDVLELAELDHLDYQVGPYAPIPAWHPRNEENGGGGEGGGTGDGGTADTGTGGESGAGGTGADTPTGEHAFPDAVKEVLRKERAARKAAETRATTAESQVQTFEDASKSELERTQAERDREKATAATASLENAKLKVAIKTKLPFELLGRLQGADEAALEADALELLKLVKPAPAGADDNGGGSGFDGGERGGGKLPLTQALIEKMSASEINARWDEIQAFAAKK